MFTNEIVVFGIIIVVLIVLFLIILKFLKLKEYKYIKSLENEIYDLKSKILNQERVIKSTKNGIKGRSALEQIKKIETLESEIKKQKQRVKDAKLIAHKADKIKSEFFLNIKHEIRTPMNSIIVFSELLVQESKESKIQNYAKNIYVAGRKLLDMIDDIIDLSRVETGTFTLVEKPVDVKALVQQIIKAQREEATRKGLELTLDIDDSIPDLLMLDEEKVEDIFMNLIENAVKFTNQGFVHVKLKENGKEIVKNSISMSLIVEDSGVGIDNEDQSKIFEIFENSGESEKTQGTGLGLSINKKIAKQMHGDISLESQPGKGSTFVFSLKEIEVVLPSATSEEFNADSIDFSLVKPEGGTIIVIDESVELRNLVRDAFFESKIKILSFNNPRDAIDALKKNQVDMILIDIDMLTSDDNAVSKMLKGISNAPVVTLTDKRVKDIDFKASAAEIAGHLQKPLLKSELFKISLQVLNSSKEKEQKILLEDEDLFENLEQSQIERFLEVANKELSSLYEQADKTNDLESIKLFAEKLLSISLDTSIDEFVNFANNLLLKIELFDIDAIHSMMKEYREKISRLKNSVV